MTTTCGPRRLSIGLPSAQDLPAKSIQAARGSDRQSRPPCSPPPWDQPLSSPIAPSAGTLSPGPAVPGGIAGARAEGGSSLLTGPADQRPLHSPQDVCVLQTTRRLLRGTESPALCPAGGEHQPPRRASTDIGITAPAPRCISDPLLRRRDSKTWHEILISLSCASRRMDFSKITFASAFPMIHGKMDPVASILSLSVTATIYSETAPPRELKC